MSLKTPGYVLIGSGVVLLLVSNSAAAAAAGVQAVWFMIGVAVTAAGLWFTVRKAQ